MSLLDFLTGKLLTASFAGNFLLQRIVLSFNQCLSPTREAGLPLYEGGGGQNFRN